MTDAETKANDLLIKFSDDQKFKSILIAARRDEYGLAEHIQIIEQVIKDYEQLLADLRVLRERN